MILDSVDQSDRLTAARSKQRQFLNFSYLYLVTFTEEILNEKLCICAVKETLIITTYRSTGYFEALDPTLSI